MCNKRLAKVDNEKLFVDFGITESDIDTNRAQSSYQRRSQEPNTAINARNLSFIIS